MQEPNEKDEAVSADDTDLEMVEDSEFAEGLAKEQGKRTGRITFWGVLRVVLIVFFSAVFLVSSYMLISAIIERQLAVQYYEEVKNEYQPVIPDYTTPVPSDTDEPVAGDNPLQTPTEPVRPGEIIMDNPTLTEMKKKYPDVVCWITVPDTKISYPVVQAKDNDYYLRRDLNGKYLISGTVFMDYRNAATFDDFKTLIYGHYMRNGTMFGNISLYNDASYLSQNRDLYISLAHVTYHYSVYAYMVIGGADSQIYSLPKNPTDRNKRDFITYVRENARYLNDDIRVNTDSMFLVLSTCSYEYDDARMVLICVAN